MTTIAFDGITLAADSLTTEFDMRVGYSNKIIKLDNGGYLAACGRAHIGRLVADWMNGKAAAPEDKQMKGSGVLFVDPKGEAWVYDETVSAPIKAEKHAVLGSGAPYAKAAMVMGADACRAVEVAIKLDISSGGKINFVKVEKQKKIKAPRVKKKKDAVIEVAIEVGKQIE